MAYETQCGGCIEYDYQGDNVKGYCSWYKCYYYPGDSCSHQKPREQSGGCYITTIICNVLGYDDDHVILNTLRNFRNSVLQKDSKYLPLLMEYDSIGPIIANCIQHEYQETKETEMWVNFYNFYLSPITNLVMEDKKEEAISRYTEMVNTLKEYYGIIDLQETIPNYDISQGGHGKIKNKIKEKCYE